MGRASSWTSFTRPKRSGLVPWTRRSNALGFRRVMFAVEDIEAIVARMRAHGAELIGEMQYEDAYRLAYIRGPEGIIVALAEQLG